MLSGKNVLVKGAGDFISGAIRRLHLAGARVVATEIEAPLTCRRMVAFSEAIFRGEHTVEGITAVKCSEDNIDQLLSASKVAVIIDPDAEILGKRRFDILIDGIMAKKNTGTRITDAPVVIAIGPGFVAGVDCHAVVETLAGHDMGRVIYEGGAAPNTGIPGPPEAYLAPCRSGVKVDFRDMVLRAPCAGAFKAHVKIGDLVEKGHVLGEVAGEPVRAKISGVVRGLLHDGVVAAEGMKIGDVDASGEVERAFTISEKGNAIAGGVLEACFVLLRKNKPRASARG
jgi:xanthine dehydrogenase accessory factor